ncbi:MAG: methyltransferase [Rhodobacter sp.]|nr:methyltransferase [Rhodobacter sp.]
MSTSRLTTALAEGAVTLPAAGRIAVFGPGAGADLSALPKARVQVIQGLKPDHDTFADQGFDTGTAPMGTYAMALISVPRAKAAARALVAEAMRVTGGGPAIVDGQKTDGVESLLRDCRRRAAVGPVVAKAHGKLFAVTGGDFDDWTAADRIVAGGFVTRPGVFSADGPDPGSQALAEALPKKLPARVADLGAGWGYLARAILDRDGVAEVHLVEADHAALNCARRNVTDPRARFHWADATRFAPDEPLGAVVTNPPFHAGRAADPGLGRAFIAAAARLLTPSGTLWLVANRHLPYEAEAQAAFAEVHQVDAARGFKILRAIRPRQTGRR